MNIPCILIPVLVGLICALLGYLLGKLFRNNHSDSSSLQYDLDACLEKSKKHSKTIEALEAELALAKRAQINTNTQSFVTSPTVSSTYNPALFESVFGRKIKENDLKVVEGIGPKIEELYHSAGIRTWKAMSEASLDKLQGVLNDAGEGFLLHDAGTWARQADLAYKGKWQELKEWQDKLDGGKE